MGCSASKANQVDLVSSVNSHAAPMVTTSTSEQQNITVSTTRRIPAQEITAIASTGVLDYKQDTTYTPLYKHVTSTADSDIPVSFPEFPSHTLLEKANRRYCALNGEYSSTGEPIPNAQPKNEYFHPANFIAIDNKARQLAKSMSLLSADMNQVVSVLTQGLSTDLQKVRSLFVWVASHQLDKLPATGTGEMYGRLSAIRSNSGSYHSLFENLCMKAGIRAEHVVGYCKGASYELGERIDIKSNRSTWSAVYLDRMWWLIDVHWAALFISGLKDPWELIDDFGKGAKESDTNGVEMRTYRVDESHFLTNPHELIYWHRPDEEKWQLLSRPVTLQEFEDMTYVRPAFFELGLQLLQQKRYEIQASNASCDIEIGLPTDGRRCRFMYQLFIHSKDGKAAEFMNTDFTRYAYLEQIPERNVLHCKIDLPRNGSYKFELFARDSTGDTDSSSYYQGVCAFRIENDVDREFQALPENTRIEWGPGQDLAQLGLIALSHTRGLIETHTGDVLLTFQTNQPVSVLATLHHNRLSNETLKKSLILWQSRSEKRVYIYIKLPEEGDYGLYIYGKDESQPGNNHPLVATYLIKASVAADNATLFPGVGEYICGEMNKESKDIAEVRLIHPRSPWLRAIRGTATAKFTCSSAIQTSYKLTLTDKGGKMETLGDSDYIFTTYTSNNEFQMDMQFPKPGIYAVDIFAKPRSATNTSLPHVYKLFVQVDEAKLKCVSFPKTYNGLWGPGCRIEGLESGQLLPNTKRNITVTIPEATDVKLINKAENGDQQWTPLQQISDSTWIGDVETGTGNSKLCVSAKKDGDSSYFTYAEYQVMNPSVKTDRQNPPEDKSGKSQLQKEKKGDETRKESEKLQKKGEEEREAIDKQQKREEEEREAIEKQQKKEEEEREARKKRLIEEKQQALSIDLQLAMSERNIEKLKAVLSEIEKNNFTKYFGKRYDDARKLLASLERTREINMILLKLDKPAIAEAKSMNRPPAAVHPVMKAVLLMFGEHEGKSEKWTTCQAMFNGSEISRNLKKFDAYAVHPDIAARARELLGQHRLEEVYQQSIVAASFYKWASKMLEEIQDISGHGKPADLKRQKQLLP